MPYPMHSLNIYFGILICSTAEEATRAGMRKGKEVDEEEEDEIVISQDDTGASAWLQSMGLDRQSFPSLEPSKVNLYPCI